MMIYECSSEVFNDAALRELMFKTLKSSSIDTIDLNSWDFIAMQQFIDKCAHWNLQANGTRYGIIERWDSAEISP